MDRVLHSAGWDEMAAGLNALDQALASRDATWKDGEGTKQLILRLANVPFGQRDWTIDPAYLEALGKTFGAGLRLVDYAADAEAARRTINALGQRSDGRPDQGAAVATGHHGDTRLTLVNAIYLKAQWTEWFADDLTKPVAFTRFDGSRVDVPMMKRFGGQSLPFAQGDGWKATQLEYLAPNDASRLAMLLVRPDDLRSFEAGLTAGQLRRIAAAVDGGMPKDIDCPGVPHDQQDAGCYEFDLTLGLPRFSVGTRASLPKVLQGLGMPLAFDSGAADFSGIHTPGPLYIGSVIHEANIDVDEKGTEAAAATAVGMDTGGGPSAGEGHHAALRPPVPVLRARRPDRRDPVHGSGHRPIDHAQVAGRSRTTRPSRRAAARLTTARASPGSPPGSRPPARGTPARRGADGARAGPHRG